MLKKMGLRINGCGLIDEGNDASNDLDRVDLRFAGIVDVLCLGPSDRDNTKVTSEHSLRDRSICTPGCIGGFKEA